MTMHELDSTFRKRVDSLKKMAASRGLVLVVELVQAESAALRAEFAAQLAEIAAAKAERLKPSA